jgi:uncharacterized DUF497 family protein
MFVADLDFEWDDGKAATNVAKHQISFEAAMAIFFEPNVIVRDTARERDGEHREKAIGMLEGKLYTAVFHRRGTSIRIISARRANTSEARAYGNR